MPQGNNKATREGHAVEERHEREHLHPLGPLERNLTGG